MIKAKQIEEIGVQRMRNGAHYTFVTNILSRAKGDAKVTAKAATYVTALEQAVAVEDECLKLSQKSLKTDTLAQADRERDSVYNSYKRAVLNYSAISVGDMAGAAEVLRQHIRDYRINTRDQLDQETGMLMNFISDLEDKYATQVETLGLTKFVARMKEANERVREVTLERDNERLGRQVGAMKAAREKTDEAYADLVMMVNALSVVNGDADYAPFIDYANLQVTQFKREALGQKSDAPDTTPGSGDGGETGGDTPGTGGGNTGGGGDTPGTGGGNTGGGGDTGDGDGGTSFD